MYARLKRLIIVTIFYKNIIRRLLKILITEGPFILTRTIIKNKSIGCPENNPTIKRLPLLKIREYNYKVSIIIPTKNHLFVLKNCLDSILEKTDYKNYEILIINNNSNETTKNYLESLKSENIRILEFKKEFNFSEISNFGAQNATGSYLIFLNNDTEVIDGNWINYLLGCAKIKKAGAVGCKLLFPNNRIQHNGIVLDKSRISRHLDYMKKEDGKENPYVSMVTAVTAASMMIKKDIFKKIGGFNERLPIIYNDLDLCLKLKKKGYLNLCINKPLLYHYESLTRGKSYDVYGYNYMKTVWINELEGK